VPGKIFKPSPTNTKYNNKIMAIKKFYNIGPRRQKVNVEGLVKRNPNKIEKVKKAIPAFCHGLIFNSTSVPFREGA